MSLVYDPPVKDSGGPTPGTIQLRQFVLGYFDVQDAVQDIKDGGIYNYRRVRGGSSLSAHAEGRAWDAMIVGKKSEGDRLADWLVANAEAIGVQEVIWFQRRWAANTLRWNPYSGASPHTDHVHVALNREASQHLTVEKLLQLDSPVAPIQTEEEEDMSSAVILKDGSGSGDVYLAVPGFKLFKLIDPDGSDVNYSINTLKIPAYTVESSDLVAEYNK